MRQVYVIPEGDDPADHVAAAAASGASEIAVGVPASMALHAPPGFTAPGVLTEPDPQPSGPPPPTMEELAAENAELRAAVEFLTVLTMPLLLPPLP